MPSFVSMLGVVPEDHGHLLGDLLDVCSVSCARKPTLLQSIRDLRSATMSINNQGPKELSKVNNEPGNSDSSTLRFSNSLTHAPLEPSAEVNPPRVQNPFRCKHKKRKPLGVNSRASSYYRGVWLRLRLLRDENLSFEWNR